MYLVQSLGDPGSGIMAQPVRAFLKNSGTSPEEIALLMGIVGLPWAMKPLFGFISDFVPIFGSRRRIYLILATLGAFLGTSLLAGLPILQGGASWLLALLLLSSIGVAFGDVLIDSIMVSEGQPRGLTGILQSVQWTAAYAGLLATGFIGGFFAQINRPDLAFALCSLLWGLSLMMALVIVKDEDVMPVHLHEFKAAIKQVFTTSGLLPVALFLFVWNFNPLWTSVLYLYLTEVMGRSEVEFGHFLSLFSLGAMVGSVTYPLYCLRISLGKLLHVSIIAGVAGNLAYLFLTPGGGQLEMAIAVLTGFTYMAGTMIHLDIAARRAPLVAAATVFAVLMSITNLASSTSEAFGGSLYAAWLGDGTEVAYRVVVLASALAPALCWLIIPWLRREVPEWF